MAAGRFLSCFRDLANIGQTGPGKVRDKNFCVEIGVGANRVRCQIETRQFLHSQTKQGSACSVLPTPGIVSCVRVPCTNVFVPGANPPVVRHKKSSGLKSAFPITLPEVGTRSRVEINAIVVPSSLIVASRLSSTTSGGFRLTIIGRLGVVLVTCRNTPVVKSVSGISSPLVRSKTSSISGKLINPDFLVAVSH